MSQEPTYPADAVPGRATPPAAVKPDDAPAAKPQAPAAAPPDNARRWQMAGVGAAIGSAAIAAALLYTTRYKKG